MSSNTYGIGDLTLGRVQLTKVQLNSGQVALFMPKVLGEIYMVFDSDSQDSDLLCSGHGLEVRPLAMEYDINGLASAK